MTTTLATARPLETSPSPLARTLDEQTASSAPRSRPWYAAAIPAHPWWWAIALVVACGWDRAVWLAVSRYVSPAIESLEAVSFVMALAGLFSLSASQTLTALQWLLYHAIKGFGTAWVSTALAAAIVIRAFFRPDTGRVRLGVRRGVLLFLCPAVAGLIAEGVKLIVRRQRPEFSDGLYSFRFTDWFSGSGLGMPSSHTAVAAAMAVALSVLYPRGRALWWMLAGLCCLSRVAAGAHFASDAIAGILVGASVAKAIVALDLRNNSGTPIPSSG